MTAEESAQALRESRMPPKASLSIILIANFLFNVSFYIIIPTVTDYSLSLNGGAIFSGLVIGVVTLTSFVSLIPLTRTPLLRDTYTPALSLACVTLILGHTLYALADIAQSRYLILFGRIVNGVGFTGWLTVKRYCTDPRIVGLRRRTMCSALLVAAQTLGMVVGPLVGGQMARIGGNSKILNGYTVPGWVMAGVWTGYWLAVKVWFKDVPSQEPKAAGEEINLEEGELTERDSAGDVKVEIHKHHKNTTRAALLLGGLMSYLAFVVFFELGSWEANIPIYGGRQFSFTHWDAGNFIGLIGLGSFVLMIPLTMYARRYQDRTILMLGIVLALVGVSVHAALLSISNSDGVHVTLATFGIAWFLVCWGLNLASTITLSLMSKVLPESVADKGALAVQLSNYTGRLLGAIWGTTSEKIGDEGLVWGQFALICVGWLGIIMAWTKLRAKTG
ncbi:major facilitator superfamily domain-containing protein [Gaertneriomyces semiglobifer]|nr:major facilitator superfamily domain-containing protein [Gaertneriomyces semiglobifer]